MFNVPLFPPAASEMAGSVDHLYFFLCLVFFVMTGIILAGIVWFSYRYRRARNPKPTQIEGSYLLETAWSVSPFLVMIVMFFWGAQIYFANAQPPRDATEIFVTGKQWMWKIQYQNGGREINELHVAVGAPVKLTMASEDVIHSFFIPAFRVKHDVIPGHYDTIWFTPSKPGRYHLFCTEYCGNQHAGMVGWVNVLSPKDYADWASGAGTQGTLAERGQTEFAQLGCATCHVMNQQGRGPTLRGLYGKQVYLADGATVVADDAYIRESILEPNAKITASFQPGIMPDFKGQITEEGIVEVIAYIKSLSSSGPASQQGTQQWPIVVAPTARSSNAPATQPLPGNGPNKQR